MRHLLNSHVGCASRTIYKIKREATPTSHPYEHEPLIITHENHKAVVLISLEDFNAWQETEYLTRSPANAKDLLQAVDDIAQRNNLVKQALIEE